MNGGFGDRWCKLTDLYASNTYYRQGWDEGYVFGTKEMDRVQDARARSASDWQRAQQQRQDDFARLNREREDQLMREEVDKMYKQQQPMRTLTPVIVRPAIPPVR